jgi:hypothetical protein
MDQFRFLRVTCLGDLNLGVGLILGNVSVMKISVPFDLSSWSLTVCLDSFVLVVPHRFYPLSLDFLVIIVLS